MVTHMSPSVLYSILRSWCHIIVQMGQSLESFMQWKSLVSLLLGCTEAVCDSKGPKL